MFAPAVRLCALAAALTILSAPGWAASCYEAPEAPKSFRATVDGAETIVLAKITSGQTAMFTAPGTVDFDFEVLETLKGDAPETFRLRGLWVKDEGAKDRGDLNAHRDPAFWDRQITRLDSTYDCGQEAVFDPRRTYLIFDPERKAKLAPLDVTREEIFEPEDDLWLQAVRDLVARPEDTHARVLSPVAYLRSQKSVALVAIESCSDKLRPDAHYVADINTLSGVPVTRETLDPGTLSDALKDCDGFTVLLGIFYGTDRETGLPINVTRKPMQQFIAVKDGKVDFDNLTTEVGRRGLPTIALQDLVAGLLPQADMNAVED